MAGKVIEVLPGKFVTVDFSGRMAQGQPKQPTKQGIGRAQAAENVEQFTGGLPAGLMGMSGDIQEMGRMGGNALMTGLGKTPVVGPMFNYLQTKMQGRAPTSEEVGQAMGYNPESGAFQAGTIGAPDWSDFRRVPNALAMTLFHGTPHKFDRFDLSKIGTGEGAQAFGWGLYFAENPGVAKNYQKILSSGDVDLHKPYGDIINDIDARLTAKLNELERSAPSEYSPDFDKAVSDIMYQKRLLQKQRDLADSGLSKAEQEWQLKKRLSERQFDLADPHDLFTVKSGHLYEVDIPDEVVDQMLDWDAPLSEQPQRLRDAMADFLMEDQYAVAGKRLAQVTGNPLVGIKLKNALVETAGDFNAAVDLVKAQGGNDDWLDLVEMGAEKIKNAGKLEFMATEIPGNGRALYEKLVKELGSPEAASKKLNELGIPGIRFYDGGSRAKGEGTRNIVVFDPDSTIKSVKRDGEEVYNALRKK